MKSETPNHRTEWQTTEILAIVGSGGLAAIEAAALVVDAGTMRSYSLIIMAIIAAVMTLYGRNHRLDAANYRHLAREGE